MYTHIEERVMDVAWYIVEKEATVRAAAKNFGVSKSTVHKDMTQRLLALDSGLAQNVQKILLKNKAERHIRGGQATRRKYKGE
ncbi:MAG: sporulation transcriptional regulator SpoIIID [Eubacteriales bacterium]|nr:sporulation transcriptional regulator SpoIIID [Eubacteriales bacterium]